MEPIVLILGFVAAAVIGWLVFLTVKYQAIIAKMELLFSDKDGDSLGEKLNTYIKAVKTVEDHCYKLDKELAKTTHVSEAGLFRKGFVRYNPFGDVGGNQSFSLALLDKKGDGFVISSIHSREGTRVYAKTVEEGKSGYNLSEEEKKSISIALKN